MCNMGRERVIFVHHSTIINVCFRRFFLQNANSDQNNKIVIINNWLKY